MASAALAAAAGGGAATAFNPLTQSSRAVMNLVACCSVGLVASKARVLDPSAVGALSRLVFNIFQPSLLFTNVVLTLASPTEARSTLILLPLCAMLQILVASSFSPLLLGLLGLSPKSQSGRSIRICTSFANAGPLPLLFTEALFKSHPDQTLRPRAVALISFYLLGWSPIFWTYGYSVLAGGDDGSSTDVITASNGAPKALEEGSVPSNTTINSGTITTNASTSVKAKLRGNPTITRIINPPLLGCVMGAVVGSVGPLRRLFLPGKAPGSWAPLGPLFDSLKTLGTAYVPCVLLVLAGSLAQGLDGSALSWSQCVEIMAVMSHRFLLMPFLAWHIVRWAQRANLLPKNDPLLTFLLLLQACMPSAQNSILILQLEKRPKEAAKLAQLVSAVYVLSILPMGLLLQAILPRVPMNSATTLPPV